MEAGQAPVHYALARRAAVALGLSLVQFIAHAESLLTKRPRAAIELDIPHPDVNAEALRAIAEGYAAINDPRYRGVLEMLVDIFRDSQAAP